MKIFRKLLTLILGLCLTFQQLALADTQLVLPAPDLVAPEIHYTPKTHFKSGELVRIEATVTDNVGVAEVSIFYRSVGDQEYRRVTMAHKPKTDIYWAVLPNNAGPQVEYYIEAADKAGNSILRGRSFDPLTLTMPATATAGNAVSPSSAQQPKKRGISKWIWIGAGVLAVGALAALAGGGGGGGGGSSTGTVGVTAAVP